MKEVVIEGDGFNEEGWRVWIGRSEKVRLFCRAHPLVGHSWKE